MKTIVAIALAGAALASSAQQEQAPQDVVIVVPAAEVAKCQAEGGCGLFTRAFIEQLQQAAQSGTCRRSLKEV